MLSILAAVAASGLYGSGVALQQRPARNVPARYAARFGLLARVARRPLWVVGVGAEIGGFALQVVALGHGSLVVVQPIITVSLLFTVALSGLWARSAVRLRDWVALVGVVAGLAAFLVAGHPGEHSQARAEPGAWTVTAAACGVGVGLVILAGFRSGGRARAALFGLAAGTGDAMVAVLTKAFAHAIDPGLGHALRSWSPYALVGVGLVALLLSQTAYQVGRPTVTLPLITVTDPIVSSAIGIALFGEVIHLDGARGPLAFLAVFVMIIGLVVLNRSTTILDPEEAAASPGP